MTLWTELARALNAAGDEINLRRKGDLYEIRFNGIELMSNINHRSEAVLAERSLRLHGGTVDRILVAGLGMGFTLRAALDWVGDNTEVTVCELVPEIVDWNRQHIGHLVGHPLRDRRVDLRVGDVQRLLERNGSDYDIILMDTDNGPDFTVRETNGAIYDASGLEAIHRRLAPDGIVAFWSATVSADFEERLDALPWRWRRDDVSLISGRADAVHHIYFAGDRLPCTARERATKEAIQKAACSSSIAQLHNGAVTVA